MKYKEVQVRENNDQQIQLAIPLLPQTVLLLCLLKSLLNLQYLILLGSI